MGISRQNWRTPKSLFYRLSHDFGPFDLDAAADDENHLCERYYTEQTDGLASPWFGKVFINPPFKNVLPWHQKAIEHATQQTKSSFVCGASCVILSPSSISSKWFHECALKYGLILLPTKRIGFVNPEKKDLKSSPDRDTIIVVYGSGFRGVSPYKIM